MSEGEKACEIDASTRDEIRYRAWLVEAAVKAGGVFSLNMTSNAD